MATNPMSFGSIKKQTMAEQIAETVAESIISGQWEGGATLPTEPELAEQFGVSRAVVRDATRILMARGLVEVKHGRGVFVTQPDNEAFGEALLLALRRTGATAWDVEQFEQHVFPAVIALAATQASDAEIAAIQELAGDYLTEMSEFQAKWFHKKAPAIEQQHLVTRYRQVMQAIFAATHNQVFVQLARPLLNLRNLRNWVEAENSSPDDVIAMERYYVEQLITAIASRDPAQARSIVARLMVLPAEAVEAMRQTPVGEIAEIPIPLPQPPAA
jgi:GntR family transcriptional regulator, transcriptional repressor for pyruvate dehydrogenase complex